MPTRAYLAMVALLLAGEATAVDSPAPLGVADLVEPRTLALQAGIGLPGAGEALFLNPAALAARRRYTVDAFYLTDRRSGLTGSERQQDYFGGTVVDSSTTALAAGFGYARAARGVEQGTLLRLGLGGALSQRLFAGVQTNYFDLRGADRVASTLNLDAGLLYQVTGMVSVGASGRNLLSSRHHDVLPRSVGLGFAAGPETSLQVVGDWTLDLNRVPKASGGWKSTSRYALGLEYLLDRAVPLRAGFQLDDTLRDVAGKGTRWWSLGTGWVSTKLALDLSFRQSTTDSRARTFGVALRVFVPAE